MLGSVESCGIKTMEQAPVVPALAKSARACPERPSIARESNGTGHPGFRMGDRKKVERLGHPPFEQSKSPPFENRKGRGILICDSTFSRRVGLPPCLQRYELQPFFRITDCNAPLSSVRSATSLRSNPDDWAVLKLKVKTG